MTRYDPLVYLPRVRVQELPKHTVVYDSSRPSKHLYLVISGRVKVYYSAYDGTQTLLRIACTEQFFGETSLVADEVTHEECAAVMEAAQVMAWTPFEIQQQVEREPLLGIALVEYCANYNLLLQTRLTGMAAYKTSIRVALSLIQLAQALGRVNADGSWRVRGMTHQAIADYAGTSREIVTSEMNRLRRFGCVKYGRAQLDVCLEALHEVLSRQGLAGELCKAMSPTA